MHRNEFIATVRKGPQLQDERGVFPPLFHFELHSTLKSVPQLHSTSNSISELHSTSNSIPED